MNTLLKIEPTPLACGLLLKSLVGVRDVQYNMYRDQV